MPNLLKLYYVVAEDEDLEVHGADLFVWEQSPEHAITAWQTYYEREDVPREIDEIPLLHQRGAISWGDVPHVWHKSEQTKAEAVAEPRLVEMAREEGLDTGAARAVARAQEAEPPSPQITIALFREQSEFVRGLLYDYLKNCEDDTQRGFADTIVDQFEQAEAED